MRAAPALVLAPPLLRLAAVALDLTILMVINLATVAALGDTKIANRETFAVLVATTALYHIGFLSVTSATPGKMALRISVRSAEGKAVRPDAAILRYLVFFLDNLFLVGAIVSLGLLFADPRRRTLHDRAAGTIVARGRPGEDDDGGDRLSQPDRGI